MGKLRKETVLSTFPSALVKSDNLELKRLLRSGPLHRKRPNTRAKEGRPKLRPWRTGIRQGMLPGHIFGRAEEFFVVRCHQVSKVLVSTLPVVQGPHGP